MVLGDPCERVIWPLHGVMTHRLRTCGLDTPSLYHYDLTEVPGNTPAISVQWRENWLARLTIQVSSGFDWTTLPGWMKSNLGWSLSPTSSMHTAYTCSHMHTYTQTHTHRKGKALEYYSLWMNFETSPLAYKLLIHKSSMPTKVDFLWLRSSVLSFWL